MDIFNFISKDGNDLLKDLSKKNLEELLRLLKIYKIGYRNFLNLEKDSTMGVEIEFSIKHPGTIQTLIDEYNIDKKLQSDKWILKHERSIINGYEVTSPKLKDTEDNWIQLRDICNIIRSNNAEITETAAAHVHIGDQILGNNHKNWINFLKLYIAYENILFRFGYGEYECERRSLPEYASPVAKELEIWLRELNYKRTNVMGLIFSMPTTYKNNALSVRKPIMDTIEFRNPNGTLNEIIWQNNINFLEHFLRYAKNADFDYDTIDRRRKEQDLSLSPLENYNRINIDQALELCDLIFDSNLDKINFLRQYLKEFDTKKEFIKSKSFTK